MSPHPITSTPGAPGTPSLRILITGANGQVGWNLQRTLGPLGDVTALTREQLDLADLDGVSSTVRDFAPDILVNAAAYTAVDKAESEPELARTINATAPARMAQELVKNRALLIHYSSDYVFDGSKPLDAAYNEDDATGPLNTYGQSKLEGERLIIESGCPYIILRSTWVYDTRGKNFLRTVLRLAQERDELRMVSDQYGAPTWARSIAEATTIILARCLAHRSETQEWVTGLFHLTAGGKTTWAEFAEAIMAEYDDCCSWPADTGEFSAPLKARHVVHITSDQYKTPARRPQNSVLSNAKVLQTFGVRMPGWREQLRLAMQDAIR
jgi:dTDP-4-dehydrorhamnose reductase